MKLFKYFPGKTVEDHKRLIMTAGKSEIWTSYLWNAIYIYSFTDTPVCSMKNRVLL